MFQAHVVAERPDTTVMRPSRCLNTRWSPLVRTWRQPAFSSSLITSRTLSGTQTFYAGLFLDLL